MSKDAILRLERTVLFQKLQEKERKDFDSQEISEQVKKVVGYVAPLLERVPENMPEFTLHDPNHSAKIVELMSQFIPADTLDHLNVIELSILIYAAYLHDLGMTASGEERETIIKTDPEYARLLRADEKRFHKLEQYKAEDDYRAITVVEDQVFTEFLRRHHVGRSAKLIMSKFSSGEFAIAWQGTPYPRLVRAVCDSHARPVHDLRDVKTWMRDALVRNLRINVQYLSLVLRLADILDLDPERTPQVLLDFINPKDSTSVIEWKKHRAVIGWQITPEYIRFEAECNEPVYERALREFLDWIEIERRDSVLLASSYRDELAKTYRFDLTEPVTKDRIRSSDDYIYSDLRFSIDHNRVLDLLMGERLYGNPVIALRELLQNAVDAVRYRAALEQEDKTPFEAAITVRLLDNKLIIEDNGIGMDEYIFENFFIQVGRSYYRSPEFRARNINSDPVSEFGIGVLSVFMIATRLDVESRARPVNPLHPTPPISVEIPTAYSYFVRRPTDRTKIGTTLILHLKPNHPFAPDKLSRMIADLAPFIEYPITIETSEEVQVYTPLKPEQVHPLPESRTYFKVTFDDPSDPILGGVQGVVHIIDGNFFSPINSYYGIVAQRGFAIKGFPSDYWSEDSEHLVTRNLELFPGWISVHVSLNLSGMAKLTLTPDRGDIVKDNKLEQLQTAIDRKLTEITQSYLEHQKKSLSRDEYVDYVEHLLDTRALASNPYGRPKYNNELKDVFLDYIPLPCISETGGISYCSGRDIIASSLITRTTLIDWPTGTSTADVRICVQQVLGEYVPILLDTLMGYDSRSNIIDIIFGPSAGLLLTHVPGVVLNLYSNDSHTLRDFLIGGMRLTYKLRSIYNNTLPLIIHPIAPYRYQDEVYNAQHALIIPFLEKDKPKNKRCSNYLRTLNRVIDDVFTEYRILPGIRIFGGRKREMDIEDSPNRLLVGILIRQPTLLDSLREAIHQCWIDAQEAGAISTDLPFPGFTADDLPWFWSYNEVANQEPKQI